MKQTLLFALLSALSLGILGSESNFDRVRVEIVPVVSSKYGYEVGNAKKIAAQKEAIIKFVRGTYGKIAFRAAEKAAAEYSTFVHSVESVSEKRYSLPNGLYKHTGTYDVYIDRRKLLKWMSVFLNIEFIILEEPPTEGSMKLHHLFGNDLNGNSFFIQNYSNYQRIIRDYLIKHLGNYGIRTVLLEDNPLYSKHKSRDGQLTGVFFDVNDNCFVINDKLLDAIRANQPDSIVIYYRIESITFNQETSKIGISLGMTLKNLSSGETRSVGNQTCVFPVDKQNNRSEIMTFVALRMGDCFRFLLNCNRAGDEIIVMAFDILSPKRQKNMKINIDTSIFPADKRKRIVYSFQKTMRDVKKITGEFSRYKNTISAPVIVQCKNLEELYIEWALPVFEEHKIAISDDMVQYDNISNTLLIRPAGNH